MFESLSNRFQNVFQSLRGEVRLTPEHVENALREIRLALLEADVNFKVVKAFVDRVRDRALGGLYGRYLFGDYCRGRIVSARLGVKGIPAEAEEVMVARNILLARLTGGHVHLAHMSTRGSVELIRWGKEQGVRVTAEVTPHHLTLTENACEGYDTHAKMNPPLRTSNDLEALREAVRDGTIDVIATDHAPHHYDAKEREFADAPFGIVGLETALGVLCTDLVHADIIDLSTLVDRLSCAPARLFHLPGGSLARGAPAHVTVFDPDVEWSVDPSAFVSKGRNTPYAQRLLRGRAVATIVDGHIIHRVTE